MFSRGFCFSAGGAGTLIRSVVVAFTVTLLLALVSCSPAGDSDAGGTPTDAGTRTVTDALGPVEVPVTPQRVVATDFFSSSLLVDVGVVPIGVMEGIGLDNSRPQRYIDALDDVEQLSTYSEINVEKVMALEPDLIIVDAAFPDAETLSRLADIAPLFHVDLTGSWSERAISVADAVNKRAEAEQQKATYDARAAEISETYREILDTMPIAIVSLNTADGTWASYAPGGWPTPAWVDIEATFREPTEGEAKTSTEWAWISDELISKLDNAAILLVVEPEQLPRYEQSSLWNALPAVEAGNVFDWFEYPATSSFQWGLDNLAAVEGILDQVNPS